MGGRLSKRTNLASSQNKWMHETELSSEDESSPEDLKSAELSGNENATEKGIECNRKNDRNSGKTTPVESPTGEIKSSGNHGIIKMKAEIKGGPEKECLNKETDMENKNRWREAINEDIAGQIGNEYIGRQLDGNMVQPREVGPMEINQHLDKDAKRAQNRQSMELPMGGQEGLNMDTKEIIKEKHRDREGSREESMVEAWEDNLMDSKENWKEFITQETKESMESGNKNIKRYWKRFQRMRDETKQIQDRNEEEGKKRTGNISLEPLENKKQKLANNMSGISAEAARLPCRKP